MTRPIMIMAGGTGGHVFPALAVADYLRDDGVPMLWLGTAKGLEASVVPEAGYRLLTLSIGGIRGKDLRTLILAPFRILYALTQALRMLNKYKPAAVLGMGGFVSGPGGLAAWLLRIPLLIHEQNAIAGLTNRCLARIATRVFEAFPGTFPSQRQALHVGNPVRKAIADLNQERLQHETLHVLIIGGSLGAIKLNRVVPGALRRLVNSVEVWHQTGQRDVDATRQRYADLSLQARVDAFIEHMESAYRWADLVICRAGAITISELAAAGLPAILIPYPHAVDDHQTANAHYLVDAGAAALITDAELEEEQLAVLINDWMNTPGKIREMAGIAKKMAMTGATEKVAQVLMEVACE